MQKTDQETPTETQDLRPQIAAGALLAISLVLLQDLVSIGVVDLATLISTIALSAAIPLNVGGFMIYMDMGERTSHLNEKHRNTFLRIKWLGAVCTIIGIDTSIWHVSWIAGTIFLIATL